MISTMRSSARSFATASAFLLLAGAFAGAPVQAQCPAGACYSDVSSRLNTSEFYVTKSNHSLGIIWIDVNNDLYPDLYAVNGFEETVANGGAAARGSHHLFVNNGDGTFTERDDLIPTMPPDIEMGGAVFGDIDNDGDSDIYVYNQNYTRDYDSDSNMEADGYVNMLLKNLAMENGCSAPPTGCDVDTLGLPGGLLFEDVAVAANIDDDVGGAYGSKYQGRRTLTAAMLDFNRDGCLDVLEAQWVPRKAGEIVNQNVLHRNDCVDSNPGDGVATMTFTDATAAANLPVHPGDGTLADDVRATLAMIAGHLDEDLWPDMYWVNVSQRSDPVSNPPSDVTDDNCQSAPCPERWFDQVWINNGAGTFTDVHTNSPGFGNDAAAGMGIDLADTALDGGGWDIYITDILPSTRDTLPLGNPFNLSNGNRTWTDNIASGAAQLASITSWGTNFYDANHDGWEDLLVGTFDDTRNSELYLNNQNGTWTEVSQSAAFTYKFSARGTAIADFDRDGDLDIAIVGVSTIQTGAFLGLYSNQWNDTQNGGNWIELKLVGTNTDQLNNGMKSNLDAIGAIIEIDHPTLGKTLRRQIKGGSSAHSQDDLVVHFGLAGFSGPVDVRVKWPSGLIEVFTGVTANATPLGAASNILVEGAGTSVFKIFADSFEDGG